MSKDIVVCQNIFMKYQSADGETEAIKDISFTVKPKEFVSIIGPSGCGKSTLLSIIAGLIKPTRGKVFINGADISENKVNIGYMPQKDSLLPFRTIRQNVFLGLEIQGKKTKENLEYGDMLLKTFGLGDFMNKYPSQLSGGMRQRAALIRTLVIRPEILLLDEAFSALDYQTRLAVSNDIHSIIKKEGKTAVMVTHDISEAVSMSERIIVLTNRPAEIKSIHEPRFGEEYDVPLKRRNHEAFREHFNKVWRDIDVHI
ncbi:MAG: ABC transporter ATP-binding protein [Clostridia bacterium]|nr:ABC transporter ATP-binding protein [Clostridia bacterium]